MKITWYGHSCFKLESADGSVVFDPYGDGSVPGYGPLRLNADLVLCSHAHGDHANAAAVSLTGRKPGMKIGTIASFHDEARGAKRGPNTIHIVWTEGMRVVHLGDLGCALEPDQIETLKGADVLMIPIGGYYTIDARQALDLIAQIEPRVVIPMHYRDAKHGYDVIATADAFLSRAFHPVFYKSPQIEIDEQTKRQTAVLSTD